MSLQATSDLVQGIWLHSHEEDEPGRRVFRRRGYALPPSRGRQGYDFRADGSVTRYGPGPADRGQGVAGAWSLETPDQLVIRPAAGPDEVLNLLDIRDDRLVVRG